MVDLNPTVLIVDDDYSLVQCARSILETAGYVVQVAYNGQEALRRTEENLPDIILLDLRMPVMDGWTCRRLLKQRPETTNIPIVVVSGDEVGAKARSDLGIGVEDFLSKPFEVDDLLSNIRKHVGSPTY